jgi:hypothetical protein
MTEEQILALLQLGLEPDQCEDDEQALYDQCDDGRSDGHGESYAERNT